MRRVASLASCSGGVPRANISYVPPLKEFRFIYKDVLDFPKHWETISKKYPSASHLPEDCTLENVDTILETAASFATQLLLPLYASGDQEGARYDSKTADVIAPKGFKEAYQRYSADGWNQVCIPKEFGGQGLPVSVNLAKVEIMATANWSWSMYPGLTLGAMNTLLLHSSAEQKQKYLPKLASGEWSGTMCLTEPQCGTDLSLCKTKAEPKDERAGIYALSGTKIFISCGDHDLADNIIHIVLARLPNSPAGVKGISLFLVPKYTDEEMAKPEDQRKKNIVCSGIEKKMGIHASPTCVMSFENSIGYLIGQPNAGLKQMFTFMNTARLGVAVQGVAHSELAYQNAYAYSTTRRAMRPLSGPQEPQQPADLIIHLPMVRHMIMTAKVIAEFGRTLVMQCAKYADSMLYMTDQAEFDKADHAVGWLTPVAKGFVTELSLEAASNAMQVMGGHGYIRDNGVEQNYRDARIGTLYEGTTQVQALDLLGRKMMLDKLRKFRSYTKETISFAAGFARDAGLFSQEGRWATSLGMLTLKYIMAITMLAARARNDRDVVNSAAMDNLYTLGYIMFARVMLMHHSAATKALKQSDVSPDDKLFLEGKLASAQFFFERIWPRVYGHLEGLKNNSKSVAPGRFEHIRPSDTQ